jgi:hypothetical protein
MGSKRTLLPAKSGQRRRPNFGITQKNERAAIDAAFCTGQPKWRAIGERIREQATKKEASR